jgi:hypothetical protein
MSMACTFDRDQLSLLVSDELSPSEAALAEAHAAQCPACGELLHQYQAHSALLSKYPAVPPWQRPTRRHGRPRLWAIAAAAAVVVVSCLAIPQARAEIARLLGFPTVSVKEIVGTWHVKGWENETIQQDDANYIRMERRVDPGRGTTDWTQSPRQATDWIGNGLLMPEVLSHANIKVFRNRDDQGRLRYAQVDVFGVIEDIKAQQGAAWFEAEYWPGGEQEQLKLTFGANWQVHMQEQTVVGLPAKLIDALNSVTNERHFELWLRQGDWTYKFKSHNPNITLDQLRQSAETLK